MIENLLGEKDALNTLLIVKTRKIIYNQKLKCKVFWAMGKNVPGDKRILSVSPILIKHKKFSYKKNL